MSIISFEIEEVSKICKNAIQNSKIIVCNESLVRINIEQTKSRQITVCLRFPENYPEQSILIELKSRTLSTKFLEGLTNICEKHTKEILGKPQIIPILKFIAQYLIENPLCIVFDEIISLKSLINGNGSELKLKQKHSLLILIARGGKYYFKIKIEISNEYPDKCIKWETHESNLPIVLCRYLNGQAREIARQCVEPPLKKLKDKKTPPTLENFKPVPSLLKTLKFIIEETQSFCEEICPICKRLVLPDEPENLITDDSNPMYVERIYCGHLYHQGCLKKYMQEPPFPAGGKVCPSTKKHPKFYDIFRIHDTNTLHQQKDQRHHQNHQNPSSPSSSSSSSSSGSCNIRIAHDRWAINIKVAETRWAQKQARERELEEVVDFLQ